MPRPAAACWTIRIVARGGRKRCTATPANGNRARITSRVRIGRRLRPFARVMPSSCLSQASAQARSERGHARVTVFIGPGDAGGAGTHGQGGDGGSLVLFDELKPAPGRVGTPDAPDLQGRRQKAVGGGGGELGVEGRLAIAGRGRLAPHWAVGDDEGPQHHAVRARGGQK